MEDIRKPSIFEVNYLYLVLGLGLILLGSLVQRRDLYSGLLITEYIIILLPNILYLKIPGFSLKEVLRLNKISIKQIILAILIVVFAYPFTLFLNAIFLPILQNFTEVIPADIPIPTNLKEYLIGFFVIAISPGICEEVMFRGTLMSGYSKLGYKKSIIISSILFGIFHFNILNLIGPIFLGIIFGIRYYKTNSIYSSMIGHTVYNGISLTILFFINKYEHIINDIPANGSDSLNGGSLILSFLIIGIIAFISLGISLVLLKRLTIGKEDIEMDSYYNLSIEKKVPKAVEYFPILIILGIFYILNFK